VYGSFANTLSLPSSDVDLVITHTNDDEENSTLLRKLEMSLDRYKDIIKSTHLIAHTLMPVLKLDLTDKYNNIKIDITVYDLRH
jgi:DNA polymerase sigma